MNNIYRAKKTDTKQEEKGETLILHRKQRENADKSEGLWRESKRRAKKSKNMLIRGFQFMTANSPMTSPEHSAENEPNVTPQSRRGRKKMRRERSKAYRKIAQLEKSIKEKERVITRYKKRM